MMIIITGMSPPACCHDFRSSFWTQAQSRSHESREYCYSDRGPLTVQVRLSWHHHHAISDESVIMIIFMIIIAGVRLTRKFQALCS